MVNATGMVNTGFQAPAHPPGVAEFLARRQYRCNGRRHLTGLHLDALFVEMHIAVVIFGVTHGQRVQIIHWNPGGLDKFQGNGVARHNPSIGTFRQIRL